MSVPQVLWEEEEEEEEEFFLLQRAPSRLTALVVFRFFMLWEVVVKVLYVGKSCQPRRLVVLRSFILHLVVSLSDAFFCFSIL